MARVCFMFPVLPGKTHEARHFFWEMQHTRRAEYDRSQRRIGITSELMFLASLPNGDYLVNLIECDDFPRALAMLVQSEEAFDRWFQQRLLDVSGMDLSNPPEGQIPELLLSYSA